MNREEYIKAMAGLEEQKKKIQEEYKSSMPIKPQQVVTIDGKEYYLKGYKIVAYTIEPILYSINPNTGKQFWNGRIYICNWHNMKPKN